MRIFLSLAVIIVLAVLLTDADTQNKSCKDKQVAYFLVQAKARDKLMLTYPQIDTASIRTPDIGTAGVDYSYLGECRHYIRAFLQSDDGRYLYEATISGYKTLGEWKINGFKFIN